MTGHCDVLGIPRLPHVHGGNNDRATLAGEAFEQFGDVQRAQAVQACSFHVVCFVGAGVGVAQVGAYALARGWIFVSSGAAGAGAA